MEILNKCPLCNNNSLSEFIQCDDYSISKETFTIVKCNTCSYCFTNPRPGINEIGSYYQSDIYISHHANKTGFIPWIYRNIRDKQFVNKTNLIKEFSTKNISLLDIGCGTGDFLQYCKSLGWNVKGVEPDEDARKQANSKQISVDSLSFLESTSEKYDVITMWHVLEHVHNLDERLQQLSSLIKDDGVIIIAVPNLNSWDAKYYKKFWAAYDVPRHISHFSIATISHLFKNHKFNLLKIVPMKFDAFYVSIKSEEYKKKSFIMNLISGTINGLKSNLDAVKTKEYSSLIYVFKK